MRIAPLYVKWKRPELVDEFWQLDERLRFIIDDVARWVDSNGFAFVVTALLSDLEADKRLNRVSTSHLEGRAADVSVKGWTAEFIEKFLKFIEAAHGKHGAISKKDGKQRIAVYHNNGNGNHIHIQVKKG